VCGNGIFHLPRPLMKGGAARRHGRPCRPPCPRRRPRAEVVGRASRPSLVAGIAHHMVLGSNSTTEANAGSDEGNAALPDAARRRPQPRGGWGWGRHQGRLPGGDRQRRVFFMHLAYQDAPCASKSWTEHTVAATGSTSRPQRRAMDDSGPLQTVPLRASCQPIRTAE
jgi:hypothetical protein